MRKRKREREREREREKERKREKERREIRETKTQQKRKKTFPPTSPTYDAPPTTCDSCLTISARIACSASVNSTCCENMRNCMPSPANAFPFSPDRSTWVSEASASNANCSEGASTNGEGGFATTTAGAEQEEEEAAATAADVDEAALRWSTWLVCDLRLGEIDIENKRYL